LVYQAKAVSFTGKGYIYIKKRSRQIIYKRAQFPFSKKNTASLANYKIKLRLLFDGW